MNIRHIYIFCNHNITSVSTRYRGKYVLQELKKNYNITGDFIYPGYQLTTIVKFILTFCKVLFLSRTHSVIIYQKLHTDGIYTRLLKLLLLLRPKKTIYDTDDADYLRYSDKNIIYFMKKCKACTVASNALIKYASQYNKSVTLLSSPVIQHTEIKQKRNKELHIGWVGDYGLNKDVTEVFSHKISLNEILFPLLKELKFPFQLTILGLKNVTDKIEIENYFSDQKNITLNIPMQVNWLDEISVYRQVSEFDIGVSPMVNHEFNISKSAFKVKQYLSCGVPVLASPIGENLTFVKEGINGFFCKNQEEFKQRIIQFNEMPIHKYDAIRNNTLKSISTFSMQNYCDTLIKVAGKL